LLILHATVADKEHRRRLDFTWRWSELGSQISRQCENSCLCPQKYK